MNLYSTDPNVLIEKAAAKLKEKKELTPPAWAAFVKTGMHKERPPVDKDWWYVRAASIMRRVQLTGPVGVAKLKRKYGGKKNRGVKPERRYDGSGNITRTILQQLEQAGLAKQASKGVHKGRVLTPQGISLLDKAAQEVTGKKAAQPTAKIEETKEEAKE